MGYEPTLIINKKDLDKVILILETEQYDLNPDVSEIARYLLEVSKRSPIKFAELQLLLCTPESSSFNNLIRQKLIDLDVEFKENS